MRALSTGHVWVQATQPTDWIDGDLWVDTSASPHNLYFNNSGTATLFTTGSGSLVTVAGLVDTLEHFIVMGMQ